MPADEDIHNALLAIHSRLDTIDGKVTLVARADRERILEVLEAVVRRSPLVGRIYLLLDGQRSQRQIREELDRQGVSTSEATISRHMKNMAREDGIAQFVRTAAAGARIYRKNREMESVLNLTARIERWLADIDEGGS
jgi:Trp operon repressor